VYLNCKWFPAIIILCFFFLVLFHVIGTYCPKCHFTVGRIVPLVLLYYKMNKLFFCYFQLAKNIRLCEATKFLFRSSSDDDAPSESSYSPDSEDCSETSARESEDTFSEVQQPGSSDDDAAGAQPSTSRDPQSNAACNSFIWHQRTASFTPKFPTHDYIPCKPTVAMPSTLQELIPSKFSFQKVSVYLLHSVQMKELTCITSNKMLRFPIPTKEKWWFF